MENGYLIAIKTKRNKMSKKLRDNSKLFVGLTGEDNLKTKYHRLPFQFKGII